jgi:hypothetical protein
LIRSGRLGADVDRRSLTPQPARKQFLSPNLSLGRNRKLSKSSEDLIGKSEKWAEDLKSGLSASLQKDLNLVRGLFLDTFFLNKSYHTEAHS